MERHNFEEEKPKFFGAGFEADRDQVRLTKSIQSVYDVIKDENWHTLESISFAIGTPEASISAHIRMLRRPENGAYFIERKYIKNGLHEYRLDHKRPTNYAPKKNKKSEGIMCDGVHYTPEQCMAAIRLANREVK